MDDISPIHDPPAAPGRRPRYRVPLGMPTRDEGRRAGAVVSVLLHALIIGFLIVPFFLPTAAIERMQQGAGGAGPAGGGGGGNRGTGGTVETLRFVKVQTQQVKTPTTLPAVPAPVPPPLPVVTPPKATPTPAETPKPQTSTTAPASPSPSPVSGSGGGSGTDGTAGAGPGTGGGVGSGVGTGRGSSNGPGTGGGNATNYTPQTVALFLPPLPPPAGVRGFKFTAEFDVDSTGRVLDYKFTPTPDGGYNRQLNSLLRTIRFRPGTRPDGTPIRAKAQIGFDF